MKWIITLLVVIILCAGGYFIAAYLSGGSLPTYGLVMGGERGAARQVVLKFWEDIKFDDPKSAAKLMMPDAQDSALVSTFLSKLFHVQPEKLDIVSYKIIAVEIDSTGSRARVKNSILAKNLTSQEAVNTEAMLFLRKVDNNWYLDLGSSF